MYKHQANQQKSQHWNWTGLWHKEPVDRKTEDEDAQKPHLGSNSDELHIS